MAIISCSAVNRFRNPVDWRAMIVAYNNDAIEQIVGRERNQRACHRQLVRNVVVARRVNSTVRRQCF